jgi:replicative DNA helicase
VSIHGEQYVLGAIFDKPDILMTCDLDLDPDAFSHWQTRRIYEEARRLHSQGKPVDMYHVADVLRGESDDEWLRLIVQSVNAAISPGSVGHHAERMPQEHRGRRAAQIAEKLAQSGAEGIDEAIQLLMDLLKTQRRYECGIDEALIEALDYLGESENSAGKVRGVSSGIEDVDRKLGGFHDSDLIVIGARPAMGKTALLRNMAMDADCPVGIISAEQPRLQIGSRLMALDARVDAKKLRGQPTSRGNTFTRCTGTTFRTKASTSRQGLSCD